ncbi:VCBS domain-containing protein, partial [Stutzerimonas stutzeri]|uniref:VCBS domain-containing protein n=1 Tax=Stutzerimonas stutzeri TaxID=316 RepID=UPI003CFE1D22
TPGQTVDLAVTGATGGSSAFSTATDTVSVTVEAVNDAPLLSVTQPGSIGEAADASAQDIAAVTGSLTVSDADIGDNLSARTVGSPTLSWSGGTLTSDQQTALAAALATGALTFGGSVTANGAAQTIGWTWDPSAANLDFLATGQTLTVSYQVAVSDGTVTSAAQPLTFTISGTDDAPVVVADSGTMTEDTVSQIFDVLANDTLDKDTGASNKLTVGTISVGTNYYGIDASDIHAAFNEDNKLEVKLVGSDWQKLTNGASLVLTINYSIEGDQGSVGSSLSVTVTGTNDAPVLDASADLAVTVAEDAGVPQGAVGFLVSEIVDLTSNGGTLDNVSDADSYATGIALSGIDSSHGTWYWSLNDGTSWIKIASASENQALLLHSSYRLYFQPAANYSGAVEAALTFHAWDRSAGTPGQTVDLAVTGATGGSSAFSTATDTVSVTV